ncbi:hypothetical protein [Promineifilum sp.]|uniref:hypothetical protein n=1 Tax=Promineifilum sp. TaxID=2664178 RepID=UPI0035AE4AA5
MAIAKEKTDAEQREEQRAALDRIRKGLATRVRILVAPDACPVCRAFEGAYEFDDVPELPLEGCSRVGGCNAVYAPVLDRFGP